MCRLSRNSEASTSWNPKGLSRPVAGKLCLFFFTRNISMYASLYSCCSGGAYSCSHRKSGGVTGRLMCEIAGFGHGWNEFVSFLCCGAWGSFNPTFRDYLSVPSSRTKMYETIEDGPVGSPETSVSNHITPHNNPEDGRIQVGYWFPLWTVNQTIEAWI
jgi:hypothetical protein